MVIVMTDIKCENCGSTNVVQEESQIHCQNCGRIFTPEKINQNEIVPADNQSPQKVEHNPQEYNFNNQTINNQTPRQEKSMILSMVFSLLFLGLGLAYLGLFKRWLISLGIFAIISFVFFPLNILWSLYMLYYTYKCTNCINEGQPIPPLAGVIDIDE